MTAPVRLPKPHPGAERITSLRDQAERIRALVDDVFGAPTQAGCDLGAGARFLSDGRVLCRERSRGDSRYPYGKDGFTLWAHSSGRISANAGPYFLLLPTEEGHDPSAAAFVGHRRRGEREFQSIAVAPSPVTANESLVRRRYTVIGHDAVYYFVETEDLRAVLRMFVASSDDGHITVYWSQHVENLSQESGEFYCVYYLNPFCRHQFFPTSEDRWFKRVTVETERGAASAFTVRTNEDINRFESRANLTLVRRCVESEGVTGTWGSTPHADRRMDPSHHVTSQHCTSWRTLVGGSNRGLANAGFLRTGQFEENVNATGFDENAVVADLSRFTLPSGGAFESHYAWSCLGEGGDEPLPKLTANEVASAFDRSERQARDRSLTKLQFEGPQGASLDAATLNHFVPFLQRQVAVCAQVRGYLQSSPNSLIGFRDVLQAIEGWLYDRPDQAREELLRTLEFVFPDGRCPRQYLLAREGGPPVADLREFIDQGPWAVSAVHTYVRVTGDVGFLAEEIGYHEPDPSGDQRLLRAQRRDSVLTHLESIVDYLAAHRDPTTGLLRTLYGDWNDAIDGLGVALDGRDKFGDGVSVTASLQFYQTCNELADLARLAAPRGARALIARLDDLRDSLRDALLRHAITHRDGQRRVLHGWGDRQSFFVGGFNDVDGRERDGLTSNAFWVLSGMLDHDPTLRSDVLAAFDRLDSRYGLKTFNPGFGADAALVGRITKLPIGAAENGAVYVHATAFAIAALFQMGEPRRAWEQIRKVLPFTDAHEALTHSPYVMPNSYSDNPELNLNGQSMNDWQTGSSNVLWKLLIRYVAGLDPGFDALRVSPAGWSPFDRLTLESVVHGVSVRITRQRGDGGSRAFKLNGVMQPPTGTDPTAGHLFLDIPYTELRPGQLNEIAVADPDE